PRGFQVSLSRLEAQRLDVADRTAGKLLPIAGVIVLGDDVIGLGLAEEGHQRGPVDDAVSGCGPAIVLAGPERRSVLGLDRDNAVSKTLQFRRGVGTGAHDPAA